MGDELILSQKDAQDFFLMAFRYALNRHSSAVNRVTMYLQGNLKHFTPKFKLQLHREIEDYLRAEMHRGFEYFSHCDYNSWSALNEEIKANLARSRE